MGEQLSGKVVLVTGASSGIGRAMARAVAAAGAQVALVGRSDERLQAVASDIGEDALALAADLTKPGEVDRVVSETVARFGRIDILLPNAGLYIPGEVAEGDPDAWDELMAINVNSVFRLARAVLPGMIERAGGHIVITSSVSGHQAIHWEPIYSASKHAIQSFVHGLRRQVARHNIRVGEVAPGVVLNELWGYNDPAAISAKVETREGLRSEDVADAVLYMLTRPANVTIRDLVILPQNQDI
ncbi:glucose dehydrogenase [Mesorhizobium sp. Root554]|uniref:SDR family oxidoreductase n=1 Tax=unclassified Mesorhizobium TaxID=325217 RepID=UPI0006F24D11|nr:MULTISPECIES: SDR family oxidoreductase [unclassified Mesorhizobium]KQZ14143.1 glucose dehydrogenase [Mesorhizobium sp. Root1471]KQZ36655.1 glucose dehydrogenase [Mesorhizobium sp. Root554]